MDDVLIEIGGKTTIPEFTENLRGANAGDEKTFDVMYPEDTQDKRLQARPSSTRSRCRPSNRNLFPNSTMISRKNSATSPLSKPSENAFAKACRPNAGTTAEREAKDKLLAELVKRNEFEVPESLVERQIDVRLERGLRALAAQGMKMEDLKKWTCRACGQANAINRCRMLRRRCYWNALRIWKKLPSGTTR